MVSLMEDDFDADFFEGNSRSIHVKTIFSISNYSVKNPDILGNSDDPILTDHLLDDLIEQLDNTHQNQQHSFYNQIECEDKVIPDLILELNQKGIFN